MFCKLICSANYYSGVGISEEYPVKIQRSDRYTIESTTDARCHASAVSSTSWIISHGPLFQKEFNSSKLRMKNVTKLVLLSNVLVYGSYKICAMSSMSVDVRFRQLVCGFLKVIASPLLAVIVNGMDVIRATEYDVSMKFNHLTKFK